MSLFSVLQLANNSLLANQIGLQTVSQNIANANTPGYSRAEVEFQAAPTQQFGSVLLGLGVQISGIRQRTDAYLNERLRGANADVASHSLQSASYQDLEGILNILSDSSLSNSFTRFFSSINNVLNQPESVSNRNIAVLNGGALAQDIRSLATRVRQFRADLDQQIKGATTEANRLVQEIGRLNLRIAQLEGGNASKSDAVGLRDQRNQALSDLSNLIGIKVSEQDSSSANVFIGGEFLVFDGTTRLLVAQTTSTNGLPSTDVQMSDSKTSIGGNGGKIGGLIAARDDILGAFLDKLDSFARTFAFEFNKVFSSGQGLKGFTQVTSLNAVKDGGAPLESAGLPFTPTSGSFNVLVKNTQTGLTQTTNVTIDLDGLGNDDTSLARLQQKLNAIDGITATVSPSGELSIVSDSPNVEFSFGDDTSGVLAALGINTFFSGAGAADLNVNGAVAADARLFAAARGGIGADANNAVQLAAFLDRPLDSLNGDTIDNLRARLVGEVTEGSASAQAIADGFESYQESLQAKQLAVSGVNIDEETVKLLTYQRSFQASAKFISIINQILESLINL